MEPTAGHPLIRVASHVLGVTAACMGTVYGVSALAEYLGGPNAANVASGVAAVFLFPVWPGGLSLGKAP